MKPFNILPARRVWGKIVLPGDKSVAHRALILTAISFGKASIFNLPPNDDCIESVKVLRALGVKIKKDKNSFVVFGRGFNGLSKPKRPLFIKESGTTFRLFTGLLAAQKFNSVLKAGRALSQRPMLRVIEPLRRMGAFIKSRKSGKDEYPPIFIKGTNLRGITYKMPVPSAQVKAAVILAGLYAKGQTKIIETVKTRDHTERMLKAFKAGIQDKGKTIVIENKQALTSPGKIYIPGDFSSAVFFMVAAIILPGSRILLKNVSLNPGRLGALKVLKRMGAGIDLISRHSPNLSGSEPIGDIIVKSSRLKATRINQKEVPSLIDELPILMVASCFARGKTVFEGVKELRVKETDRIRSMVYNLKKLGAEIRVSGSGKTENIIIIGADNLKGASLKSFGDHRTAMSSIIAGLAACGRSRIDDTSCINKSFPGFVSTLMSLRN